MELRKEYADIVERELIGWTASHALESTMRAVALACQELADRPPRELTDAEIHKVVALHGYVAADGGMLHKMLKAVEAAVHAKQREPQVVKFRAARCKDGRVEVFRSDCVFTSDLWEWLDADGKAQEFEVRI